MIAIERFSNLVNSTRQSGRQQVSINVEDAHALLTDIIVLQDRVIQLQDIALKAVQEPTPSSIEADGGKF